VFLPHLAEAAPAQLSVDRRPSDAEWAAANAIVPDQPWHVAVVLAGEVEPAGWWGPGRAAIWADAVEAARVAVSAAGIPGDRISVRAAEYAPWHPGRCAAVLVDDAVIGYAGELHPAVVSTLELPRRACAMELNLDAIPAAPVVQARRLSTYPPALIDVALVVDAAVPAASVEAALVAGAGELLESVRLFDVYESDQLGAGCAAWRTS
jgi:phenylalanyl-tRNA synthetase beta chain